MALLPFTPFQQFSRHWESVCPQNSGQVMLVEGVMDPDTVESAFQSTLRDMGLGRVHVDEDEGGYSHEIWSGDPPAPLVSHHSGSEDVSEYLQTEVNRPFLAPPVLPYRAFALQRDEGCYLGVIYQQWVGDSVSVQLLMREWFLRIFQPNKARKRLIDLPRIRVAKGPEIGYRPGDLFRAARFWWQWHKEAQDYRRFPATIAGARVTLSSIRLEAPQLDDLLMITRAEGCTVNDLLIAVLAATLEPELRQEEEKATSIAIATSIDLRPYLPGALGETFGSLLAYAPVVCKLPCPNRLNLAQEVGRQTHSMKDPERIAQYLLLPRLITWLANRREGEARLELYRKHATVAASLANVNLNKSWPVLHHPSPLKRYIRVASPSPAMPLVLSTTTLGDSFEAVLAASDGSIKPEQSERIMAGFAKNLQALVQSRPSRRGDKGNG